MEKCKIKDDTLDSIKNSNKFKILIIRIKIKTYGKYEY